MAKRTTAMSLKHLCAHQRALRNFLKHAFTCQRPQLYIDQVPRRSTHTPLSYRRDGQTDGQTDRRTDVISALYSRYVTLSHLRSKEIPVYIYDIALAVEC